MEKLTDAEVVEALECCIGDGCSDCPYTHVYGNCKAKRNNDCIDLIKRKDAEIEKLKTELVSADEVIGFREAEIERYKKNEKFINEKCDSILEEAKKIPHALKMDIAQAKSEAYKEFAERLKETIPHYIDGYTTMECVMGAIRYIEKELTEGTKNENE